MAVTDAIEAGTRTLSEVVAFAEQEYIHQRGACLHSHSGSVNYGTDGEEFHRLTLAMRTACELIGQIILQTPDDPKISIEILSRTASDFQRMVRDTLFDIETEPSDTLSARTSKKTVLQNTATPHSRTILE